jgi:uncharacterized protein (TIGR03000 family)
VNIPVGATLTVNGMRTEQMTAVRKFISPPLPSGQKFYYTFLAYYTQDGEGVTKKKIVEVTAGAAITVNVVSGETISAPKPKFIAPASPFDSTDDEKPKKPANEKSKPKNGP